MANVTIYSTPTCVYCKMAKEYFTKNNVAYTELDVAADMKAREDMFDKTNQLGVPVIEIDDNIVIGFDQKTIEGLLGLKKAA